MRKFILSFIVCMMAICSCTDRDNKVILSQIRELSQIRAYQYSVTAMKYGKEKGGALFGDKVTGYYNGHVDVGIGSVDDITMQVSDDGTTATVNAKASVLNAKGWFIDDAPRPWLRFRCGERHFQGKSAMKTERLARAHREIRSGCL